MQNSKLESFEKAYDKRLEKDFVANLKRPSVIPSRDELIEHIKTFLEENVICTLATCADNIPRATVLRYRSSNLKIYALTEGGGKIYNIKENPLVSVTVCGEYTGFLSVKGVQAWGRAIIVKPSDPSYAEGSEIMGLSAREDLKEAELDQDIPDMILLRIDIERARFLSFPDGIINRSVMLGDDDKS